MSQPPRSRTGQTADGFLLLLSALAPDPNIADERFRALHSKLSTYFHYARCSDPEHWADETIERVARRLVEGTGVGDVHAFVYGVARLVALEARRADQRSRDLINAYVPAPPPIDEPGLLCLERCLGTLSASHRRLIERYYAGGGEALIESRKTLAKELGITVETLRTRALRIRKELESCIVGCQNSRGLSVTPPEFLTLVREEPER